MSRKWLLFSFLIGGASVLALGTGFLPILFLPLVLVFAPRRYDDDG